MPPAMKPLAWTAACLTVAGAAILILATPVHGQETTLPGEAPRAVAGIPVALPFDVLYDYEVFLDDEPLADAACYNNPRQPGLLIVSEQLGGAYFARTADRKIVAVRPGKIQTSEERALLVVPDGLGETITGFAQQGASMEFNLEGRKVRVQARPPLLGQKTLGEVLEASPAYRQIMSLYEPDAGALGFLKQFPGAVDVEVYFGSWCQTCKHFLPQFIRTISDCGNPKIHVTFIGLPRQFADEEKVKQRQIEGVPCVIVLKEGREVGRITGPPMLSYEKDLGELLRLAASSKS